MNIEQQPKILVCTVNAWNEKVGDNTFSLLLQDYPKSSLASLFIREETPNFSLCDKYFRISEKKVMRSVFRRREKTGYVVKENEVGPTEKKSNYYGNKRKFYYTKLFCREAVWAAGKWKTKELDEFIDSFAPDVVIYEMSRYIHLNNIVRYILKRTKAQGVGCVWDDTFTYKQEKSVGYKVLRFFQRKNLKKLAKHTKVFFAITPKTKKEADEFFGVQSTVLTKPIPQETEFQRKEFCFPLKMLYTGNVGIGRLDVLKRIVKELAIVNEDANKLTLEIYTNTPVSESDKIQLNTDFSAIYPPVSQGEVIELQKKADILLFVEGLGSDNKIARLSFSTKITDYYAAGKCIFAVGNKDLAPIELFADTDSAIVATNEVELCQKLRYVLDFDIISEYAQKSFKTGRAYHSYDKIEKIFFDNINDALATENATS